MVAHGQQSNQEKPLPAIEGLAVALRWVEEIISTASGVALTIALSFPVLNIFSDGKFYAISSNLSLIAALAMTVGVDGQLLGSAYRLAQRINYRETGGVVFESFNVLILSLTVYLGAYVSGYQETFSVTTSAAFGALGIDKALWLALRVGVSVYLLVLSGLRRFVKPKAKKSLEQVLADADYEAQVAKAKASVRKAQINAWAGSLKATANQLRGVEDIEESENDADTDEATQVDSDTPSTTPARSAKRGKGKRGKLRVVRATTTPEDAQRMIRAALMADSTMGNGKIQNWIKAHFQGKTLSTSTIARYKEAILAQVRHERVS